MQLVAQIAFAGGISTVTGRCLLSKGQTIIADNRKNDRAECTDLVMRERKFFAYISHFLFEYSVCLYYIRSWLEAQCKLQLQCRQPATKLLH